ncbi:capsular polysaccharide biosynthesis protein [Bacteroidia bacterium]|nr:capsular polysaccharide biosynthesis protein [Bacteroidia bacterium]
MIEHFLKLFPKLRTFPHLPRKIIFLFDLFSALFAFLLTTFIYVELTSIPINWNRFLEKALICVGITGLSFFAFKTYSGLLRYSTFKDALRIWFAIFCANVILAIIYFIAYQRFFITLSIFFINFLLTFIFIFSFRMLVRVIFDYVNRIHDNRIKMSPMLVYGVEPSNINLAKMIETGDNSNYKIIGFISTSNISHQKIMGKPIYYKDVFYNNIHKFNQVKAILIQPEDINRLEKQVLAEICYQNKIELMAAPSIQKWKSDRNEINNFNIEDLLGRAPIEIDTDTIRKNLEGKRALVTGAAGSIGSEIVRQLCQFNLELLILCDIAETPLHQLGLNLKEAFPDVKFVSIIADVRNKGKMEHIFSAYNPHCVYHAAAYKHVPMMENHPGEAILTNVLGSKNVADMALAYGAENFVMISTDKAVNPSNVMGASKRIAEIYIQALFGHLEKENTENSPSTRFITTRFGNVLGSNGSVIPIFEKQIKEGGPVTVTDPDIIRYFMTIPEACSLVLEAGNFGKGGEIFIFDMGEPVKIKDMAEEMIRLSGFKPYEEINIVFTGLRPGEKLYEELLYDKETHNPTHNKKIMVANVCKQDIKKISPLLNQLIEISYSCDNMKIVKIMKQIVPEFVSINSEFEVLDEH